MILPLSSRSRARLVADLAAQKNGNHRGDETDLHFRVAELGLGNGKVKSASVAMPQPPAMAAPLTAAIIGFGKL